MLTPLAGGGRTDGEKHFCYHQSRLRCKVECAFGRLVARYFKSDAPTSNPSSGPDRTTTLQVGCPVASACCLDRHGRTGDRGMRPAAQLVCSSTPSPFFPSLTCALSLCLSIVSLCISLFLSHALSLFLSLSLSLFLFLSLLTTKCKLCTRCAGDGMATWSSEWNVRCPGLNTEKGRAGAGANRPSSRNVYGVPHNMLGSAPRVSGKRASRLEMEKVRARIVGSFTDDPPSAKRQRTADPRLAKGGCVRDVSPVDRSKVQGSEGRI